MALGAISLSGLLLRLAYLLFEEGRLVDGDGQYYHHASNFLVDGLGYINPVTYLISGAEVPAATHPPAWTTLLALPSLLGFRTLLEHQIFAALVGTCAVLLAGLAGRRIAGPRVGLVAAGIAAVYPNYWLYERELLSETLVFVFGAATILVSYRFLDQPNVRNAVLVGLGFGALCITRGEQFLLFAALVVPLIWAVRRRSDVSPVALLALTAVVGGLVVAPWVAYNLSRFEEPVFLTTTAGEALRIGNCDSTYYGDRLGTFDRGCPDIRRRPENRRKDASVVDADRRDIGLDYLSDHLERLPVVVLAREGRTFGLFAPVDQSRNDTVRGTRVEVVRAGYLAYWALALLAVAGGVVLHRRGRSLIPLLAPVVVVVLTVAATFGQTRYRGPAEPSIVLLGAVGGDAVVRILGRSRFLRRERSAAQ